jgi:superfamily I DNA/RNA helicase
MLKKAKLIGGAGTGKTTELLQIMKSIIGPLGGDPTSIGFGSFTRAAREEMVARASNAFDVHPSMLSKHGWFKTVHATCHKMLNIRQDQLLSGDDKSVKWIADQLRVTVQRKMVDDSGYASYVGDEDAAAAMTLWDISRNRVVPIDEVHREKSNAGLDVPSISAIKHFIRKYEDAKRLHDRCDFVDIVGWYAGVRFELDGPQMVEPAGDLPQGVKAWILDEYQDSSKLVDMVCRRLVSGPEVRWVYVAADPFQSIFGFGGPTTRTFCRGKSIRRRRCRSRGGAQSRSWNWASGA